MSEIEAMDHDDADGGLGSTLEAGEENLSVAPECFSVHDADSASWLIRRILEARAYGDHVAAWAEREKRRARREEEFYWSRYGAQLRAWVGGQVEGKRTRSVALPGGRAGFRFVGESLSIDDANAVLAWARESCPGAIAITERLSKNAIAEHYEATGELPDGAHIEPEHDAFYVR